MSAICLLKTKSKYQVMGFQASSPGQTVLDITAAAEYDVLNVPYAIDQTDGWIFANSYVEISVAGTSYWIQLFNAPA